MIYLATGVHLINGFDRWKIGDGHFPIIEDDKIFIRFPADSFDFRCAPRFIDFSGHAEEVPITRNSFSEMVLTQSAVPGFTTAAAAAEPPELHLPI